MLKSIHRLTLMVPLGGIMLFSGCEKPPAPKAETPPAPVTVAIATQRTVPVQVRSIGNVKVISTVSIRPRVSGELNAVHFREGDDVRKGDRLFTIDPRPYESAMRQAEASLERNKAVLAGATRDLERIDRVKGGGAIAAVEIDTARTAVDTALAAVAADEAALHSAKLQLEFTKITSPINGRTGSLLVTPGNLVSPTDVQPLVIINQISPIYVGFSLPERELIAVTAARGARPLTVAAYVRDGQSPEVGTLAFIDNAVDPTTGTVLLKAEFPNESRTLWPGQFVDVIMTLGERPNSIVVPSSAIQTGQQGTFVYMVTPENIVEVRPVAVLFDQAGEAVIDAGLSGGEVVVTEGHLRLAPGAKVAIKNEASNEEVAE